MTTYFLLTASYDGLKRLELFDVVSDESKRCWLVKFINHRVTYKWFYDFSLAAAYYEKSLARHFLKKII